ncbi:MAG: hypothetical protein ACYDEC_01140 [Bacteroidia bacterium]
MRSPKTLIVLILFLFSYTAGYSQFKNEDELKKQAGKYFEEEDYANGFKLYSQLVANYPKDPTYNFRFGVCMLYTDADKKKPIPYLNIAAKTAKDNEKEALFYLGKAYHFNYRFDEAIDYYTQYKNIASASMIKKLQVDREIQACKNGKRLLSNLEELVVLDKKQLSEGDYFRSYDMAAIGGKLLVKPDEFRTSADKKKKDKSIIYLSKSNDQLYYAGYGEKGDNKDIYTVKKLPDGNWSKPENLGTPINTEFDEDYPFLHPNGVVLYFASKGHNSMGGYDLFKSELDTNSSKWKEPVNLAFPINSPNDDILFVTDSIEKIAFFASSRQSPFGKIDVFKILTEKRPAEFAFISGTVLKEDPNQSVLSKIKIKNMETGEDVGSFNANADGTYSLKLPNGGKFIFTVETPGFSTQSESVIVPTAYTYMPYKQAINYEDKKLYISNFFDVKGDDENNYKKYLDLIAQKSKMDVNVTDFGINPDNPLATSNNNKAATNNQVADNTNQIKESNNEVENNNTQTNRDSNEETNSHKETDNNKQVTDAKNKNLSNKELIQMAYNDANELQQNADSLKEEAAAAFSAANSKQDQANLKKQDAEQTQNKANAETDAAKKQELITEVSKRNDEANLLTAQSTTANDIAKQLEIDATNKQKEADLNLQYAKALEEAEKTKNNKQAVAKLEDLQRQLEEASKQKSNSNTLIENIKADANNKKQELQNAQTRQEKIEGDIKEITNEINTIDKQISETNDKDLLENYKSQKQELETDLTDKKKEKETNQNKINSLKEESEVLKSQADFAASIVGGTNISESITNNQITSNTTNETATTSNQQENKNVPTNNQSNNQEITNNNTQPTNTEATTNNEVVNNSTATNETPKNNLNNNQGENNTATNLSSSQTNNPQQQIDDLNKQADDLSTQARQIRKDAKTLTGSDKQNALNKISEIEKQATDLHYKAAKQQIGVDENSFSSNQQNIQVLLQNPENSQNADKVNQLAEEARVLSKAAQELKEESEADPSIDSRVGGLSNADEKQKAALAKQEEALKLLKGSKSLTTNTNTVTNNRVESINNEVQNNQAQNETNITNPVTNNTVEPTNNEVQNNQTQNETTNPITSNTNEPTNNEVQNNQTQNETNNTNSVTNNTVEPTNNETQNNQSQNEATNTNPVTSNTTESTNNEVQNNQTQNETTSTNPIANNTVTPSNIQTAGNLSPQQINEIKNTPEYIQYNTLQKETLKYTSQAVKEQNQADLYKNRAEENLKRAEQLKADADALPDGNEKQEKLQQAETLEKNGTVLKEKADSMQELASDARGFTESKKQEVDAYTQILDKKTFDNIVAVNTVTGTTNPSSENKTTTNPSNTDTQSNQANTNAVNEPNTTSNQGTTETQKHLDIKGFEIKQGNAYSKTHPIPFNEKLPEGLMFRVQIGAFKNPIPLDAFKGLSPIGGENTPQGFIRYQVGLFDKFNHANAVKNDLKKLGYADAFVVAYLNGKRINLADALASLQQKGENVNADVTTTAGITANNNVPVNNTQTANVIGETQTAQSSNLPKVNGLLFTIQIGIFTNNVINKQLRNLRPIYREQLPNGNYRFTAGIYNSLDLVKIDRRKVNTFGIGDAFVSAYLNGQRIKIADAIEKVSTDKTLQFPTQQPIIFPGETTQAGNNEQVVGHNNQVTNENIQPFSNGVTESPLPTAENGIKTTDEGITYKVQIGAFRKQVPQQTADTWIKLKTWPIKNITVNDLYIYTVGSFTEARYAQKLKAEVIALGITDAFIVVFKDGKRQ